MNKLGVTINLLRHGFGAIPNKSFAMRISGNGPFKVELRPLAHIEGARGSRKDCTLFRAWWSQEICRCQMMEFLSSIKPIQNITRVKKPIEFFIDENGDFPHSKETQN